MEHLLWCDVVSSAIFPNNVQTVHWTTAHSNLWPNPPDVVDFGETRCDPLLSTLVQFWPIFLLWIAYHPEALTWPTVAGGINVTPTFLITSSSSLSGKELATCLIIPWPLQNSLTQFEQKMHTQHLLCVICTAWVCILNSWVSKSDSSFVPITWAPVSKQKTATGVAVSSPFS